MWQVELPDAPVVNHNSRGHWNKRYDSHRQWRDNTAWCVTASGIYDEFPEPPVSVTLHCIQSDRRRRDVDNHVGGTPLKGALDGLVDAGLLEDDSWRQVYETRCRLASNPNLDVHRWVLTVESV